MPSIAGETPVEIAPDGRALTITFSDLEVAVGNTAAASGGSTTTFPVELQLTGGAPTKRLRFAVSGYAFTVGATARLTLDTGGHRVDRKFADQSDNEFVQTLEVAAILGSRIHLSIALEVHALAESDERTGYLNALALDAEIV